jgi:hypothetical protein
MPRLHGHREIVADMSRGIKPYLCEECNEIYDNRESPSSCWKGGLVCENCWYELNAEEMDAMHEWNQMGEAYQ